MTSWENQFQELKQQFIFRSRERLSAIENLLDQMQYRPGDSNLLREIRKHFHWLAGSGGTYGFDEITQWGTYGEELCEYLLKLQVPVKEEDREKLLSAFETVQVLFAAAGPASEPQGQDSSVQNFRSTEEMLVAPKPTDLRSEMTGSTLSSNYQRTGEYNAGAAPAQGYADVPTTSYGSGAGGASNPYSGNNSTYAGEPSSYTGSGSGAGYPSSGAGGSYSSSGASYTGSGGGPSYSGSGASYSGSGAGSAYTGPSSSGASGVGTGSGQGAPSAGSGSTSSYGPGAGASYSGAVSGGPYTDAGSGPLYNNSSSFDSVAADTEETIITSYTGPNAVSSKNQAPPAANSITSSFGKPTTENRLPLSSDSAAMPVSKPPLAGPPLTSGHVIQQPPAHSFAAGIRQTGEFARPRLTHVPLNKPLAILLDAGQTNLSPLKAALEERSIHVESFASVAVVRSLLSERLPDYLLIMIPLPDGDGYELIEYLRGLDGGHRPAVLMLAQQAGFLDKVLAIRAGANAFFEYPAEHQETLQKLTDLAELNQPVTYKILSVEDDQNQADFIKLTLETAGYKVFHLADPKKFEDTFLSFEPDLLLLDVMLGDVTGFELARYIRQNDRFAALPIVFLTTQNKLHQHIRSAIAGGDEHLVKPVAPQLLIATVASRLEKARALKKLIDRDGLTRCLNYGTFMERAQRVVAPENFRNGPALMMIDIDNLLLINDQYGFANGDRVISSISNILLKGFRNTDMIARFGNDQFAIILEHLTDVQLQSLASQVLGAISNTPQILKGRNVTVTCSCGVAALEQGMPLSTWIAAAEDALRKAKEGGKNRAIVRPNSKGSYRG